MTNILETEFDCNGTPTTVATPQLAGESMADLAARHDAEVAEAEKDCTSSTHTLGPIQTTWSATSGTITYASPTSYGKVAHAADVVKLKVIYPPE